MTILPLLGRELRVRARSRAGYWTRFGAALAGILVCVPALTGYSGWSSSQAQMGAWAFQGLVVAAFILCCFSGFLTVDGISRERREGTLGLLFLTRVRALDVLLGKFGAAGLAGLCALAAFVPVLIVPVLAGGVTGAEAARKVLALFDTMILSLAAGLWASTRRREWSSCARSAAGLLVLVIFGPLLLERLVPSLSGLNRSWPGPINALVTADDVLYRRFSFAYWNSIATVLAITCLLVIGAGFRLRRALREEDETPLVKPPADDEARSGFMLAKFEIKLRRRVPLAEGQAPLEWLMHRQGSARSVVWAGVLLIAAYHLGFWYYPRLAGRLSGMSLFWGVWLALSVMEGCLFGWAASRFFIEARRTGELELLLTTPEGARTIVTSQWKWLKSVFCWPLIALVTVQIIPGLMTRLINMRTNHYLTGTDYVTYFIFSQLLVGLNAVASIVALVWSGMWFGWSERSQGRAIVRIVLSARMAPYLIVVLAFLVRSPRFMVTINGQYNPWGVLAALASPILVLLYYLWLTRWAWRRLRREAGQGAVGTPDQRKDSSWPS